jgi:hypothetical protein
LQSIAKGEETMDENKNFEPPVVQPSPITTGTEGSALKKFQESKVKQPSDQPEQPSEEQVKEIDQANAERDARVAKEGVPEGEIGIRVKPESDPKQDSTHGVHGGSLDPDSVGRYELWFAQHWTPEMLAAGDDKEGYRKYLAARGFQY